MDNGQVQLVVLLLIYICWKVYSEARMKSLIHIEYLFFARAMILILITAIAVISFCILSAMLRTWWSYKQHCVGIRVFPDVNIILHDRIECGLLDATGLHSQEGGLKEYFWTLEQLADDDHLSLRLVALLQDAGGHCSVHCLLKVRGYRAELLLDVTHDFLFTVVVKV